jgi:hypothetical protein
MHNFKPNGFVYYGDFGAKGNGKTDFIDAIEVVRVLKNVCWNL